MEAEGSQRSIHYARIVRANSHLSTKGTSNAITPIFVFFPRVVVSDTLRPSAARREIMRDLRRYVPLMELKCAKRHVKSGRPLPPRDGAARFIAHRSMRVACGRSRDKGSRIREPEVDVEVASTGARACSRSGSQLFLFRLLFVVAISPIDDTTLESSINLCSIFQQYIFERWIFEK